VKLSSKGRYAVRALFDIAFYNEGRPTQVKDIAERQGIPPRFLEQIFQELKRAGIVGSKRGPQGGYLLTQGAESIRLGDVVRALEGPISLGSDDGLDLEGTESAPAAPAARGANGTSGVRGGRRPRRDAPDGHLATESIFRDLSTRVESCFDAVTVADICTRARELGIKRPHPQGYVYVI
jgi:Rrf2 family transcriptional regulator, iron-sulfur cluster assembly transcription factor